MKFLNNLSIQSSLCKESYISYSKCFKAKQLSNTHLIRGFGKSNQLNLIISLK